MDFLVAALDFEDYFSAILQMFKHSKSFELFIIKHCCNVELQFESTFQMKRMRKSLIFQIEFNYLHKI